MVAIELKYTGELHCEAVHTPSGTLLSTDAPKDNQGRGESFSPTDLVATALGACMLTVMGIASRTLNTSIEGATCQVVKEMSAAPRRIARLQVTLNMPAGIPTDVRPAFEKAAYSCPVHHSLHPDVQMPITFIWND